ncbi:MAG: lipocalin family protein [Bacteriovoracaceae bacterium]
MKSIILLVAILSCLQAFATDLPTVKNVEVNRYIGKWYAHYSLPQYFTRKCLGQTAEYKIIDDKTISVFNTCLKKKGMSTINGQAVVTNPGDNSELIVTFNQFFTKLFRVKGDYNILALDIDYKYVLVGSDNRKSLWLMSRSPEAIPEDVKADYLGLAKDLGFNINKLKLSTF